MTQIEDVTRMLERLQNQCVQDYPDQTILDLHYQPLKCTKWGTYHLGIEDVLRSETNPSVMDPLFYDIPGFPGEIEDALKQITTTARCHASKTSEYKEH